MLESVVRYLGGEEVKQDGELLWIAVSKRTVQTIPLHKLLDQRYDDLSVALLDGSCQRVFVLKLLQ